MFRKPNKRKKFDEISFVNSLHSILLFISEEYPWLYINLANVLFSASLYLFYAVLPVKTPLNYRHKF